MSRTFLGKQSQATADWCKQWHYSYLTYKDGSTKVMKDQVDHSFEIADTDRVNLVSARICRRVTTLNYDACGHADIKHITLPNGLSAIGEYAFYRCQNLLDIDIPKTVTQIGESAFSSCIHITRAILPNGLSSIEDNTFSYCTKLKTVTIPESVTTIKASAFTGCQSINRLTLPASITTIGYQAFSGCIRLKCMCIPENVTSISPGAFSSCSSLKEIAVNSSNKQYKTLDGVLFSKSITTLLCCPAGKAGNYVVPSTVEDIQAEAFCGCNGLTSITISDNVGVIDARTFSGCSALKTLTIGSDVYDISNMGVFSGCDSLELIDLTRNRNFSYADKDYYHSLWSLSDKTRILFYDSPKA